MERLESRVVELGEQGDRRRKVAESWRLTKMLISHKQEIQKKKKK